MRKISFLWFAFLFLSLFPKEAWVSGSHGVSFLEPEFSYTYQEFNTKKLPPDRYQEHFRSRRLESQRRYLALLPELKRLIANAKKEGVSITTLGALELSSMTTHAPAQTSLASFLAHATTQAGPVRLELTPKELQTGESENVLTLWIGKPLSSGQAKWLWQESRKSSFLTNDETSPAAGSKESPKNAFVQTLAAEHYGKKFSYAVFLVQAIRQESVAHFKKQLESEASRVFPKVEKFFETTKNLNEYLDGDLAKLGPAHAKNATQFNPFGPLSDDLGYREGTWAGQFHHMLLFNPGVTPTAKFSNWFESTVWVKE